MAQNDYYRSSMTAVQIENTLLGRGNCLPFPVASRNGNLGQVLTSKGDGTTEWSDAGQPTEAQIAAGISDYFDEHPAARADIDDTLSTSGMAADAKVTGDNIRSIEKYNPSDMLLGLNWPNHNWQGIVATWNGNNYTFSGTATALTNLTVFSNATSFPGSIKPGDDLAFHVESTGTIPLIHIYLYRNGAWDGAYIVADGYQLHIPNDCTGMILRFVVQSGQSVNGTCRIECTNMPTNPDIGKVLSIVNPSDTVYRTSSINFRLGLNGIVTLAAGTYKIANLKMPDNTILRGCGDSTVLIVDEGANGILPGANCTIENLRITSAAGHTSERGSGSGILVQGNYDNAPLKYNTKISNVTIDGFACGGIHGKATGYWVADSISAINCKITNCWSGILFEDFSEFNRVTNCLVYGCYIGANIYSGNNVLVNCSLSNNTVGVYLVGTNASLSGNTGHGAIIGCTINHSNNNNGYGLIAVGIFNGFLFTSCNIWYSKIIVNPSDDRITTGLVFANCLFGGGTPEITNWGATALFLNGCIFKATPTFAGNALTIKNNCYMFDGTAIT